MMRFLYPHDSITFVLRFSNPSILLDLGCSGFTQGMKVVLRETEIVTASEKQKQLKH